MKRTQYSRTSPRPTHTHKSSLENIRQNGLSASLATVSNGQRCMIAWTSWESRFAPGATELRRAAMGLAKISRNVFTRAFDWPQQDTFYFPVCCYSKL